ncbi:MAG: hypothetical protein ACLQU4_03605 [Limisphaerales bacterium]
MALEIKNLVIKVIHILNKLTAWMPSVAPQSGTASNQWPIAAGLKVWPPLEKDEKGLAKHATQQITR